MISLDSIYAMLARPINRVEPPKRVVQQTSHTGELEADSHESPQSQLPPHLERRRGGDRRASFRGERRGQHSAGPDNPKPVDDTSQPHIDIEV
ncbi:hypothetical protein LZP69_14175 [Shewanella sp. AS1]|uniref:hypothetical protein n=1 Tax=Shewanella sp. AS1 TaxID=2907626 RepID=UPI001F398B04|nr:hypothetical protein [Shewanella sp. AS1]MCE9680302.1 hypothetical protein [Shewanella sp. AS1]